MPDIHAVLERNKAALLALPGCTAVAISYKKVSGRTTAIPSIVVYVDRKKPTAPEHAVPPSIEGIATDVVEQHFDFRATATNPFDRFDPLIGGVSLTALEDSAVYGTIGCFIDVDGHVPPTPAGIYLLTNQHVVQVAAAAGGDRRVIQPGNVANPPANYVTGLFMAGQRDATHDCAITTIGRRGYRNEVPNHPLHPGNRALTGVAVAAVGDRVYKYGATTKHTTGTVTDVNFNIPGGIQNAIRIVGENNGIWCDGGDSGSVAIRYADDRVVGLNFVGDAHTTVPGGYRAGLAYDIATQMQVFGGVVRLA